MGSPNGNVCITRGDQMYIPVQPGTRIPARLFVEVFQSHCKNIILPVAVQQFGNIEVKGVVAIGPVAGLLPVNIYTGIAHRTVELYGHPLIFRKIRDRETVAVPPDSGKRKTSRAAVMLYGCSLPVLHNGHAVNVVLFVERAVNSPVVGYPYRLPAAVVEGSFRCKAVIFPRELPSLLQRHLHSDLSPRQRKAYDQGNANQYRFFHHSYC